MVTNMGVSSSITGNFHGKQHNNHEMKLKWFIMMGNMGFIQ